MVSHYYLLIFAFAYVAYALPQSLGKRDDSTLHWTALGDSYASGVGAGEYITGSWRCLRYQQAYPMQLNNDQGLSPNQHVFQNCVCSGATTQDVELYQFYDEDTSHKPNWEYGDRPKIGSPEMVTLSVGGDNVDFPGIIFNCLLETHIPGGPATRGCTEQRRITWSLINDLAFIDKIDHLIKKVVAKGRAGQVGNNFKLYLTGYAEFFNEVDEACDSVTFARTANPKPDGKPHTLLTREIRKDFNKMVLATSAAILVAFIDIQANGAADGHRFCEPGIHESDQQNPNLWFYHYPYNEPDDGDAKLVDDAVAKVMAGLVSQADIAAKYPTTRFFTDAIYAAFDFKAGDTNNPWPWKDFIGPRVKSFHPQIDYHTHIKDLVLSRYKTDLIIEAASHLLPLPKPPAPKATSFQCHGVSGSVWVVSRDKVVENSANFCSQPSKSVDCANWFKNSIIDACDGNDAVNNPYNYKYGATLQLSDGWTLKMEPLAQQPNLVACDVSWEGVYDYFEIRGSNWPNSYLGPNGEGLLQQLRGCGVVTDWSFEMTPNDVTYQWYSHGKLPVGNKNSAGWAVTSSGGSGIGNCWGAG